MQIGGRFDEEGAHFEQSGVPVAASPGFPLAHLYGRTPPLGRADTIGFGTAGAVILGACRNVPDVPRRSGRSLAAGARQTRSV